MSLGDRRAHVLRTIDELPPLNQVARHLLSLLGDDRTSAGDLDRIIRNDQALTARVLKHANSSVFGKSRRISSLTEAVVLMGDARLSDLVLSAGVDDVVGESGIPGFSEAAWDHSIDCAAAARALARFEGAIDPDTAFVAGLMHDIGLLVVARAAPAEMAALWAANPEDPQGAERQLLGLNHSQVGQKLLEKWNLPAPLCEAVRLHHAPHRKYAALNPLVNLVALADLLATIDGAAIYPAGARGDLFGLLRLCGVTPDRLGELFSDLARSRDEADRLLSAVRGRPARGVADSSPGKPGIYFVYAVDDLRRAWYEGVLRHLGRTVGPLGATPPTDAGPSWIVADLHGASPEARGRIADLAGRQGLPLALVETSLPPGEPWRDAPRLPMVFTDRVVAALNLTLV
ncbi:MAG: HDOD domain-containing protein [bacterium]|nr:HDOD domain-containing protein [bacterium]